MQQYFEIPSLDQTVRKSILDGITYRVLAESGIDDSEVIFGDKYNTAHQVGSTEGEETPVAFAATNRTYVTVSERREEMARINRQVGMNVELPFFDNRRDEVNARPVRTGYDVEITLKRNNQSGDELNRWINRLNSLIDMGRYSLVTEAEGYYFIPAGALELLQACYHASEARVPHYNDFREYMEASFAKTVFTTSNVAGGQVALAVRYSPTRVEVTYDTTEPEWDKDENHYEASFTIKFYYQCPEEVVVTYPYIINQTALPEKWWPEIDPPWVNNEEFVRRSQQQAEQDATWYLNEKRRLIQLPYLLCPSEQFHRLHAPWNKIALPIFGTDVAFDADNMTHPQVMTVDDLPYQWNPALLPYINHCRRVDPTGMTGLFRMSAYQNGILIDPKFYAWDGPAFHLKYDILVQKNYFLIEQVLFDWRGIDLYPLHLYPKAAEILVKWLFPSWETPDAWWDYDKLPPSIWDKIVDKVGSQKDRDYYLTVFNTGILTIKGE